MPDLDAIFFVTEPPTIRIDDGLVFIESHLSGALRFERVMRLHTLLHTMQLAKEAIAEYETRGIAEVIPFPRKRRGGH